MSSRAPDLVEPKDLQLASSFAVYLVRLLCSWSGPRFGAWSVASNSQRNVLCIRGARDLLMLLGRMVSIPLQEVCAELYYNMPYMLLVCCFRS